MGKIRQDNRIGDDKSYIPDETLVNFIQNRLHLLKKKAALTLEGKELSEEEKKQIRESDRMKVYVLEKIIFPSFVNLLYFFEALAASPRLSESFDDEVAELLDPRKAAEAAKFSGSGNRFSSMQFRTNNLARLVIAILNIHTNRDGGRKPETNFRVGLLFQLQTIVGDIMDRLIMSEYSFNQIWKSAMEDYGRMMGWMALLVRVSEEQPIEYDRKIGFLPIWISNKAAISEMEF